MADTAGVAAVKQALAGAGVTVEDFDDSALNCLLLGGYTTVNKIKAATREGLDRCNLLPADQDVLLAQLTPSGLFDMDALLRSRTLPPCEYQAPLTLSGTVSLHSDVPQRLKKWSFAIEANKWGKNRAKTLQGRTVTLTRVTAVMLQDGVFQVTEEAGLYSYWDNILAPALTALWTNGLLEEVPTITKGALVQGQSDRGVCFPPSKVILPIEMKHKYALPPGKSPFVNYKPTSAGEEKTAQQKHVEQVFGYLSRNGLKYGILCTDEDYYFLKRERTTLFYSDAIKRDQVGPSVICAVCYITYLALLEQGPAKTRAGGGPGGGGRLKLYKMWSWLVASLMGLLQSLCMWLRPKDRYAPKTIRSSSLNLGRRLGHGITGVVYYGISPLGRQLAIKVPSREGRRKQGKELQLQQLHNEVAAYQALTKLQGSVLPTFEMHGTLVTDAGDRIPFIAIEFLEGGMPLSELTVDQWPSTLAADASAALAAVHAHGVAQCDVRAQNLFLMPDGTLKVLDFGHARMGSAAGPEDMARDVQDLRSLLAELKPWEQGRLGQPAREVLVGTTDDGVQAGMSRMARGFNQVCPSDRGLGVSAGAFPFRLSASAGRATSNSHKIGLRRAYGSVSRAVRVRPSLRLG